MVENEKEFQTIIEFPQELKEKLEKICSDIKKTAEKKGETFPYTISGNKIIIKSDNKKRAWARGFWFKQSGNYSEDEDENRRYRRKIHFEVKEVA